jgi:type III restriction enzyme
VLRFLAGGRCNGCRNRQAKATAAVKWCKAGSDHARTTGGKAWHYLLIADDQLLLNATLDGLAVRFSRT